MDFSSFIMTINNLLWATPLIALTFGLAIIYCIAMKFGNVTKTGLQWKLLRSGSGSQTGLSAFETFCSIAAYRVAVGNIGGVMVAIMYGGPGSVFWMIITALVTSAIAYAENSLGQIYKVRMDGQYRGGPYFYMEKGIPWKGLGKAFAVIFALFATVGVPLLVTGPSANNIAMAFENSFGMSRGLTGVIVAVLLFLVISGGVRRIAKFSTIIVPFMTIGYLIVTIAVLVHNASAIPYTFSMMIGSAFNVHSVFGGMIGGAFSYGVKRAVNSSGSGFGETPSAAAAAETAHPATQGLVNAFSVYIDVAVCFCSGIMALVTDCFNVLGPDGTFMHIGQGSAQMAAQAETMTAGVVWVQEAANTALPNGIGGMIIALALFFFAYSTCIAYYYEGESGLAYLCRNMSEKTRGKLIWATRIIMPIFFLIWANVTASTAWAISEIMFALMAWFNLVTLAILLPKVKKVYDDYMAQRKAGVEDPYFDPDKVGIENCEIWTEINKDRIHADKAT
ncbi:alanine/glycine:cation symporter family protein [Oscillibacter sp. GMB15532]|uniref:alanine/glycine:cation symporter family protein n=1 Tax=Oscillibacter sp. GMB15532 TaxID=3230022 RepID=UPI0034DF74BC